MGKAVRASALVLLLACTTYAGDIQNGVTSPPPAPQTVTQEEQSVNDYIRNAEPEAEPDRLTETVLNLLSDVLALF
jgi:hypothetical protein